MSAEHNATNNLFENLTPEARFYACQFLQETGRTLMSTSEVVKFLCISLSTLHRLIQRGDIRTVKISGTHRFELSVVAEIRSKGTLPILPKEMDATGQPLRRRGRPRKVITPSELGLAE